MNMQTKKPLTGASHFQPRTSHSDSSSPLLHLSHWIWEKNLYPCVEKNNLVEISYKTQNTPLPRKSLQANHQISNTHLTDEQFLIEFKLQALPFLEEAIKSQTLLMTVSLYLLLQTEAHPSRI